MMRQTEIFAPVFVMIALTFVVWVYMYARRIPFIVSQGLPPDKLTPQEFASISPPAVANPSDNLKNLFEIPVLFYVVCVYLYLTQQVDVTYVVAAWVFTGFRVLHSVVHCTFNLIVLRFWLYAIATVTFWFMAGRAALDFLSG